MADLDVHLGAIVSGNAEAFGSWVAGSEARLRASLARFATRVDTEAVVQETLLRIWQLAPRHRPDGRPNSLLRLAIRIARNLAVDEVRRKRPLPTADPELEALGNANPEGWQGPDPLLRRVIAECLERLTGKPRLALVARLSDGGAEPDTRLASRLGMRVNTFLQNITRARRQLARCLEQHGVDLMEAWK
jgi:RNA polymerase sigma-70 factor (ECF subfamily)